MRVEWNKANRFEAGDYWKDEEGIWMAVTPNGMYCSLANHQVTENSDNTITVTPSILVNNGEGGLKWHGYLENGIWKEC